jgi:hypothetical protein
MTGNESRDILLEDDEEMVIIKVGTAVPEERGSLALVSISGPAAIHAVTESGMPSVSSCGA